MSVASFQARVRPRLGQDGFTLAEILIACGIIAVGLVAASYAFTMGIQGVETGRQQSTAVFLAQQRMEQIKAAAAKTSEPPLVDITAANFPNEGYDSISGAEKFRRAVTFTSYTGPAGGLPTGFQGIRVDVDVFYLPITATGVLTTERSVRLSSFLAAK